MRFFRSVTDDSVWVNAADVTAFQITYDHLVLAHLRQPIVMVPDNPTTFLVIFVAPSQVDGRLQALDFIRDVLEELR